MAKTQNKPHLTNFIKHNYIWILMIITMSCIHLLYMYLIGARKQDVVYAAVLDAILLLITVLVGFFRYSSQAIPYERLLFYVGAPDKDPDIGYETTA